MCDHNLTMKFPADFHNYTGLNGLVNSSSQFTIAPPNKLILSCKHHWSAKRKKTTTCEKWLSGVLQKRFTKHFTMFTEKYLCYSLFLILLKAFRSSGLQLYWRENPTLVFQNKLFVDSLQNTCSWIIHKIYRKTPMLESLFKWNLEVDIHKCSSK